MSVLLWVLIMRKVGAVQHLFEANKETISSTCCLKIAAKESFSNYEWSLNEHSSELWFLWIKILLFFSIDIVSCSQSKHVYFTWLESHPSCYIQVNKWTSIFSMIFAVQHLALEVELDNLKRRSAQAQLLRKLRVSCTHSDPNFAPNPQKWRPLRTARQ